MDFAPVFEPKQMESEKIDIIEFLESIYQYDAVVAGQRHCFICGRRITLDNFSTIAPVGASLAFCCDDPLCSQEFSQYQQ